MSLLEVTLTLLGVDDADTLDGATVDRVGADRLLDATRRTALAAQHATERADALEGTGLAVLERRANRNRIRGHGNLLAC